MLTPPATWDPCGSPLPWVASFCPLASSFMVVSVSPCTISIFCKSWDLTFNGFHISKGLWGMAWLYRAMSWHRVFPFTRAAWFLRVSIWGEMEQQGVRRGESLWGQDDGEGSWTAQGPQHFFLVILFISHKLWSAGYYNPRFTDG